MLQIGTGPGYLVALIPRIVGSEGLVVSLEIDRDLSKASSKRLTSPGYTNAWCIPEDGYFGYTLDSPYVRIVETASCADVLHHWIEQLVEDSILVLPFSFTQRASTYPMIAFRKTGFTFSGKVSSPLVCVGFIPLYGNSIEYPVLYESKISKLEGSLYRHLQINHHKGENFKSISLLASLEIGRTVETGFANLVRL